MKKRAPAGGSSRRIKAAKRIPARLLQSEGACSELDRFHRAAYKLLDESRGARYNCALSLATLAFITAWLMDNPRQE